MSMTFHNKAICTNSGTLALMVPVAVFASMMAVNSKCFHRMALWKRQHSSALLWFLDLRIFKKKKRIYLQPGTTFLSLSPLWSTENKGRGRREGRQTWAAMRDKHNVVRRFIAWQLQYWKILYLLFIVTTTELFLFLLTNQSVLLAWQVPERYRFPSSVMFVVMFLVYLSPVC